MSQIDEMQVLKDALREVMSKLLREKYDVDGLVSRISGDLISQAMGSPASGAGALHRAAIAQAAVSARDEAVSFDNERKGGK